MTRMAVGFDRVIALLTGVALVALAVLTVAWQRGALGDGRPLQVVFATATTTSWWPWASAAAGVVLILAGLRWLLAHHPATKANSVTLSGGQSEEFSADAVAAARAAADRLSLQSTVLKATGTAVIERGSPVVLLNVTVPARGGLTEVVDDVDDVLRTVHEMLGGVVAVRGVVGVKATKRTVR
jgi:hypothetical protein